MTSYAETRDSEQMRLLQGAIDAFIAASQSRPPSGSTCARQTVFFFPGGMASQLKRATQPYQEGVPGQTFQYEVVWVNLPATVLGGAADLEMHRDVTGTFRDKNDRIIVADGSVSLGNCTPHQGFADWCAGNNVDLFVFDWDWRRRLDEAAGFFVGTFLPAFRQRVTAAGLPDPLAAFSVVGHSFGGMVANLVLRNNAPLLAGMKSAITVGTPFYGYAGQMHRWFEGDPYLNGPLDVFKNDIVRTVCSLPALYTLLFLATDTFGDSANQAALAGNVYPLSAYPCTDKATGVPADPYAPQTNGTLVRYPFNRGFDIGELDYGGMQARLLCGPMAPALLAKFHNIRGVRSALDTAGAVTWDWIGSSFNPMWDASPIADAAQVAGDDTQPAWTAHLLGNPRCVDVAASDIDHMWLMSHPKVIDAIAGILCAPGATVSPPHEVLVGELASEKEVKDFLLWLSKHLPLRKKKWPPLTDPEALRALLPKRYADRLGPISRRFLMDVFKRPVAPNTQPRRRKKERAQKPRAPRKPRRKSAKKK